jgi:hypothetical protein
MGRLAQWRAGCKGQSHKSPEQRAAVPIMRANHFARRATTPALQSCGVHGFSRAVSGVVNSGFVRHSVVHADE